LLRCSEEGEDAKKYKGVTEAQKDVTEAQNGNAATVA
jgi:hypothetical protein